METERRFEIELPDSGRIVWRFQGDVPVSRLKTLRRLIKPSEVAPASPVATEVSVRRLPFTERQEFGTAPSRTILRTHRLSARMAAADRVEILLHETGDETLLRELYTLQRIIWYGFLPLLLRRKLLVLHGSLLALDGRGVLLCGSSGSGKSTCARRVPAPWRALADDAVLVSAAEDGIYAQGLPTWSRLLPGRTGPRVDVNDRVELSGLYHLAQSPEDRIGTLTGSEAINVVIRSFLDFSGIWKIHPGNALRRDISLAAMDFAQYANRRADTGRLHCTLHGEFWKELEGRLSAAPLIRRSETEASYGVSSH